MKEKNLIHIGTFNKPLGLKGEVYISLLFSNFESFCSRKIYLDLEGNKKWNFIYFKKRNNKFIGLIKGYNSRTTANDLAGKKIYIEKRKLDVVEKKSINLSNLINFKIINLNKTTLGTVISIDNFGAGNLINVKTNNKKSFYIPMNKENVKEIDSEKKIVIVNPIKGIID